MRLGASEAVSVQPRQLLVDFVLLCIPGSGNGKFVALQVLRTIAHLARVHVGVSQQNGRAFVAVHDTFVLARS